MSVAVFTAISGNYDTLKPHIDIPDVDFICFTDKELSVKGWRVVPLEPGGDPRLTAKYPKVIGHPELSRYDFTIWIDGSMEILSPAFVGKALCNLGPDGFSLHLHSYRSCIFDEARESLKSRKYDGQPIQEQVDSYRSEGYPCHAGLWSCASMARAKSKHLEKAMADWMQEIETWTLQDQISLPYVLWKHGIHPSPWPHYPPRSRQSPNPWLEIHKHADGT